ncbi:hypothetical protein [Vulgatibacter incomptus]|nr:hypothetical protein [Vulgatibacter incomptus]
MGRLGLDLPPDPSLDACLDALRAPVPGPACSPAPWVLAGEEASPRSGW